LKGGALLSNFNRIYRTHQVWIKPGHRLFAYLDQTCQHAKNLYNTTNFYVRQIITSFRQKQSLQPLQQQVLDILEEHIDLMNKRRRGQNRSQAFQLPSEEQPFVDYNFLDALFKVMNQVNYRALPAQSSQGIMKVVFQNWKAFFSSIKDYRKHPGKHSGKPRIPGYARNRVKEVVFSNQDCVIQERKFLKFPKTKLRLNIGKLGYTDGKLMQVRVVPRHGHYIVEMIFSCVMKQKTVEQPHVLAIDLGIENLATMVTTTGAKPVIVKGKIIKAMNQYYNKMKAHYTSVLRQSKKPSEGTFTSKRLERLHLKRYRRMKDLFHKTSYHIVQLAVQQNTGIIIIGHHNGWKYAPEMGRKTNQSFCHIPHQMLIAMITYKATEQGIAVILTEEAYTSKASFLAKDPLPRYDEKGSRSFSGKRVHRGMYKCTKGLIHADVNGAANIMRKVFPNVSAQGTDGIEGLDGHQTINVSTPLVLSILK